MSKILSKICRRLASAISLIGRIFEVCLRWISESVNLFFESRQRERQRAATNTKLFCLQRKFSFLVKLSLNKISIDHYEYEMKSEIWNLCSSPRVGESESWWCMWIINYAKYLLESRDWTYSLIASHVSCLWQLAGFFLVHNHTRRVCETTVRKAVARD